MVSVRILEAPAEMDSVEEIQRAVWPGSETDIVPAHMLIATVHNGGLVLGAYDDSKIVGFVFGFIGLDRRAGQNRYKHCSHMMGVHPEYRDQGVGAALKQAQWQMVRRQGFDLITWTYDPLLSRNANLNIAKLGAVCHTYQREVYGDMRDTLNVGLPADRFEVELWVNSQRVNARLGKKPRRRLDMAHYFAAGAQVLNPTEIREDGHPRPHKPSLEEITLPDESATTGLAPREAPIFLLVEIPPDFMALKDQDDQLALDWRLHSRELFETLFSRRYMVTDFVYLPGDQPRSFYVLSFGESTLGD